MKTLLLTLVFATFLFSKDKIDVNFNNLELLQLIKITSKTLGKNILVSQNIDAKVNFVSNEPISKKELLDILKLSLKENGYALEEEKGLLKVVKIKETRVKAVEEKN